MEFSQNIKKALDLLYSDPTITGLPFLKLKPRKNILVLPIHWRQEASCDLYSMKSPSDSCSDSSEEESNSRSTTSDSKEKQRKQKVLTLQDITLKSVPGIRSLISDVVLDGKKILQDKLTEAIHTLL
jgi:hypothetical protein